jgi:hypothetical protein
MNFHGQGIAKCERGSKGGYTGIYPISSFKEVTTEIQSRYFKQLEIKKTGG